MPRTYSSLVVSLFFAAAGCSGDPNAAENPIPGITQLAPSSVLRGSLGRVVEIEGFDFVPTSVVQINGVARGTEYVSAHLLRATLTSSDFANAGDAQVIVVNPPPGGGSSSPAALTVTAGPHPIPVLTTVDPSAITAGGPAVTVRIGGSDFVPESRVLVGTSSKPTVFVSSGELLVIFSAAELATAGTFDIQVANPFPGGGVSSVATLEVRSPAPVLAGLATTQLTAGLAEFTLRVTGTGFLANSEARLDGAPRPTTFVNGTNLDVFLSDADLRGAGTLAITVVNPSPGGGTSNALSLQLITGAPELSLIPSQGAHAGRSGFSLWVHGRAFVPEATVHWNGSARPTQYVSGTRLIAEISDADVSVPGGAAITVVTPAPGGGTSQPGTIAIRALGAATVTSSRVQRFVARDLAWDESSGRLYLSVAAGAPQDPNNVIAVDPVSGAVTGRVFVGSEPTRLALSRDGQFLYVGLNGAGSVRRVELPSLTSGLQWSLGAGQVAGDIEVVPGSPRSVAVSRHDLGSSPALQGVTIYDDGTARPQSSPGHTGGSRIEFLDSPTTLYGYNNESGGFQLFTIGIDATGARHLNSTGGLLSGFSTNITGAAGRIYGTNGSIVDADRRTRVALFPAVGDAMLVDAAAGRAFILTSTGIAVYDLNTFQHLGTISLAGVGQTPPSQLSHRLVRWGTDGLAFLDADELFIVRSPIVAR